METDPYMQALLAGANDNIGVDEFQTQDVPCTIYCKHGPWFIVKDVNAWGYMELGVFATGRYMEDPPDHERSMLIPYDEIKAIEFDFEALEQFQAQQGEEAVV